MKKKMSEEKSSRFLLVFILVVFSTLALLLLTSPWRYVGKTGESFWQMSMALSRSPFTPYIDTFGEFSNFPPLYSWFTRLAMIGTGNVEAAGRIVSFVSGIGALLLTFKICASLYGRKTGYVAMLLLATSLLFLVLSTVLMAETTVLFFSALSIFFLMKFSETGKNKYLLVTGAAAFLSAFAKWPGIFTLVGVGAYLLYTKGVKILKNPFLYVSMLGPVLLCLAWISHIPFTKPMISGELLGGHMIFYIEEPLSKILTHIGYDLIVYIPLTTFCLALVGIVSTKKESRLPIFWLMGGALFYLLFLKGIGHHHYSYLMLPPLAILGARGAIVFSNKIGSRVKTKKHLILPTLSAILLLIASVEIGYVSLYFHQRYGPYAEDIHLAEEYMQQNAGENGLIALSEDWVYLYFYSSIDIARVRGIRPPYWESIENLEETPKIIAILVRNPNGKPSLELGLLENEFEGELSKILTLDNYQLLKGYSYFRIIAKAG